MLHRALFGGCLFLFPLLGLTQEKVDPKIPKPRSVLGFSVGDKPARHDQILRYFEALAKASPRATLTEMGKTHEGRRLVYLTISSAANQARLAQIRAGHQQLAKGGAPAADLPALAWLGYSIHGDEISGSDAAMAVAYQLVAGTDARSARLRKALVVRIDPCENPDGRSRYLAQLTSLSKVVPNPDPAGIAHTAFWPWGRGNHYLFDLNRDWFTLVHPESQARARAISAWWPQLMIDAHEMGSDETFLFSPPRAPFNPHLPFYIRQWWKTFAGDHGAAFDRKGWGYYTREWNEELYPGYGSSWPMYGGAIGILYEQSRTTGTQVRQKGRGILRYRNAVARQTTSSLANLNTLAVNRAKILTHWAEGRRRARAPSGKIRAFLLPAGADRGRVRRLVRTLISQGIEVQRNAAPITLDGLRDYWTGAPRQVTLAGGSYLIRTAQGLGPLVRNLLDFHIPLPPGFLREERQYQERGKGSRLYETTAWSLPMTYGVEAYWTDANPSGAWTPVTQASLAAPAGGIARRARTRLFGYLVDGSSDDAAFLTARLLDAGVRLRVARKPFRSGGISYAAGSILVPLVGNKAGIDRVVDRLARRSGVVVQEATSARSEKGPDLGGGQFPALVQPRIAVLTGDPISTASYGAIWHLLDRRLQIRFSGIDVGRIGGLDLSRYNVLIVPPARGDLSGRIGKSGLRKIKRWVDAGGTLIGIGGAVSLLANKQLGLVATRRRRDALEQFPPVVLGPDARTVERAGRLRAGGVRPTAKPDKKAKTPKKAPGDPYDVAPLVGPGARAFLPAKTPVYRLPKTLLSLQDWIQPIARGGDKARKATARRADGRLRRFRPQGVFLRLDLDPEHWLAFGSPKRIPVHYDEGQALVADASVEIPARFAGLRTLHISGLLWPEAAGRIARTAYVTRERRGKGQVILFVDDPIYRGASWASQRLFLNAVTLGPGLGSSWPRRW